MPPETVGEALRSGQSRLLSTSKEPRRDAELLLMHVLGCDRVALLTHPERPLPPAHRSQYDAALGRRQANEPIQYITGVQEFFGLSIRVTPDVLIPRPETEHLVEEALALLRAPQSGRPGKAIEVLDVGTGSGAIAVAIAAQMSHASVTAVDLSAAALEVARENSRRHGVDGQIRFLVSDLLSAVPAPQFDMIAANPPYVSTAETLEPQVAGYEPHAALFAGPTGLEIYQRLIPQAWDGLRPGGWLLLEIGHGQRTAVLGLLGQWKDVRFVCDLQAIPRVAIARR